MSRDHEQTATLSRESRTAIATATGRRSKTGGARRPSRRYRLFAPSEAPSPLPLSPLVARCRLRLTRRSRSIHSRPDKARAIPLMLLARGIRVS